VSGTSSRLLSSSLIALTSRLSALLILLLLALDALLRARDRLIRHKALSLLINALDVRVRRRHAFLRASSRAFWVLLPAAGGLRNLVAVRVDKARARLVAGLELDLALQLLDLLLVEEIAILVAVLDAFLPGQDFLPGDDGEGRFWRARDGWLVLWRRGDWNLFLLAARRRVDLWWRGLSVCGLRWCRYGDRRLCNRTVGFVLSCGFAVSWQLAHSQ
jgi:hypothetical protein